MYSMMFCNMHAFLLFIFFVKREVALTNLIKSRVGNSSVGFKLLKAIGQLVITFFGCNLVLAV